MAAIDPDALGFLLNDISRLIRASMDRAHAQSGIGVTPGEARVLALGRGGRWCVIAAPPLHLSPRPQEYWEQKGSSLKLAYLGLDFYCYIGN